MQWKRNIHGYPFVKRKRKQLMIEFDVPSSSWEQGGFFLLMIVKVWKRHFPMQFGIKR